MRTDFIIPAQSIADLLHVCASVAPKTTPQLRGLYCEALVAKCLHTAGFIFRGHRVPTPFAELDLVFSKPAGTTYLFEIKSLAQRDQLAWRVSFQQRARLRRAWIHWQSSSQQPTRFVLAFVSPENEITWVEDFLS